MKKLFVVAAALALANLSQAQLLMEETFSYPNGALTNVAPSGLWNWHSGSGGALTLNVVDGRAFVNQTTGGGGGDDYNRSFTSTIDPTTDNTSKLYASFLVNFSAPPSDTPGNTSGSYFAHFKSTATGEFYGRVGANMESGALRLALANETWSQSASIEFPRDLSLNQDYRVVLRLDLATDQSTMWVDPVGESSDSVTATDTFGFLTGSINAFALRQGTSGSPAAGTGALYVDDLRVGTSFESVTVIPEPTGLVILAGLAFLARGRFIRRS